MSTAILRLPNGIRDTKGNWTKEVEIDEMEGEEEDILTDQAREEGGTGLFKVSGPSRITSILSRCTTRIGEDTRPAGQDRYRLPDYFRTAWDNAFSTDRVFAMVRLRQLSLGPIYRFDQNCPSCKREIKNIVIDLARLSVSEKKLEDVMELQRKMQLPRSKDVLVWRFLQGKDEDMIDTIMKEHKSDFISVMLYRRILGVYPWDEATSSNSSINPESPIPGGLSYVKRMKSMDRRFMATSFDSAEGGVDTDITIVCDNSECRHEFSTKLQVMGGSFFFPSATLSPASSTSAALPSAGDGAQKPSLESPSASVDG